MVTTAREGGRVPSFMELTICPGEGTDPQEEWEGRRAGSAPRRKTEGVRGGGAALWLGASQRGGGPQPDSERLGWVEKRKAFWGGGGSSLSRDRTETGRGYFILVNARTCFAFFIAVAHHLG